jgi:hypothetical protein
MHKNGRAAGRHEKVINALLQNAQRTQVVDFIELQVLLF